MNKIRPVVAGLICFVVLLPGCTQERVQSLNEEEAVVPEAPVIRIPDIPIDRDDPSPISGRYEVVDFHLSPVAAIDENEALDWLGQLVVFSEDIVGSEMDVCDAPSFVQETLSFSDHFSVFDVSFDQFGLESSAFEVISVRCGNEPWIGVGGETFRIAGDTLVTVYDGVFLSLEPY